MATPEQEVYDDSTNGDDTAPWVSEGDEDISIGDLSAVQERDIIETARNVLVDIRKASLDTQEYSLPEEDGGDKVWAKRNLALQIALTEGVNEAGKYKGKVFFPRLLLEVNRSDFPDAFQYDKYASDGKAFRPIKQFYRAMGGDVKNVQITRAWRDELAGRQVRLDIVKKAKRRNVDGEWVDDGFEQVFENFKSAE